MAGVDLLHLPYEGTGQALTDLLAGPIQVLLAPAQTVMPHVQAGKLRALAPGGEPASNTPEEFAHFIREDMAKWSKWTKDMGIVPQ